MIVRSTPDGILLFTQSAHALLAFQLAEHWGNRHTPRPSPRAEVLAAVLLHDAGWDSRDQAPHLLPDGALADFRSWPPEEEREKLWEESLASARTRGRYVEYLVGHHILYLAETYSPGRHEAYVSGLRQRLGDLAGELQREPRYAQIFRTGQDEANRQVLRVVDALAVWLCLSPEAETALHGAPFKKGPATLRARRITETAVKLDPWPFCGPRVTVAVEARRLPLDARSDPETVRRAWPHAGAWTSKLTLHRWSTPIPSQ